MNAEYRPSWRDSAEPAGRRGRGRPSSVKHHSRLEPLHLGIAILLPHVT